MAEDGLTLQVEPRSVLGKTVRHLRRRGIVPGNIYGRGLESVAVQAPLQEWRRVFRQIDRNALVTVQVADEDGTRAVVLRAVTRHPTTDEIQHIELYQVDLTREIVAAVALTVVGDAPAVAQGGVLVQVLDHAQVAALPLQMPSTVEVDISGLAEFGSSIHLRDLALPAGARFLADLESTVVAAQAPRILAAEEAEAEAAAAEALAAGEVEPAEAVEGEEAPAEEEGGGAPARPRE